MDKLVSSANDTTYEFYPSQNCQMKVKLSDGWYTMEQLDKIVQEYNRMLLGEALE